MHGRRTKKYGVKKARGAAKIVAPKNKMQKQKKFLEKFGDSESLWGAAFCPAGAAPCHISPLRDRTTPFLQNDHYTNRHQIVIIVYRKKVIFNPKQIKICWVWPRLNAYSKRVIWIWVRGWENCRGHQSFSVSTTSLLYNYNLQCLMNVRFGNLSLVKLLSKKRRPFEIKSQLHLQYRCFYYSDIII